MSVISKFLGNILSPNNWAVHSYLQLADATTNGSEIHQFRVTLTSAQILALHATPVSLIAAPGAGKYISLQEVMAYLNFKTTQYTGTNAVEIRYTDGSGNKLTGDLAAAWLDGGSSAAAKATAAAVTPIANAAVVAVVPVANPAAGDSTVTIEGKYRVVTLP